MKKNKDKQYKAIFIILIITFVILLFEQMHHQTQERKRLMEYMMNYALTEKRNIEIDGCLIEYLEDYNDIRIGLLCY